MFELSEEHRMLQDLVAKFVDRDLIPLEKPRCWRARCPGRRSALTPRRKKRLARHSARSSACGAWTCRRNSAAPTCPPSR